MNSIIIMLKYFKTNIGWYIRFPKKYLEGRRLVKFKDIHKGERCFIIATGPSLTLQDVEKLKHEITFGVNSIIGFFDKTEWRPTYYGIIDANSYDQLDINKMKEIDVVFYNSTLPYPYSNGYKIPMRINQQCHNTNLPNRYPKIFHWTKFSEDITKCVWDGRTVVYSMLQIATYMGFKEIYLLGTDCNYKGKEQYNRDLAYTNNEKDLKVGDYMIECYKVAAEYQKTHDVKIYNATRGGMLEIFERVDLDKILKG